MATGNDPKEYQLTLQGGDVASLSEQTWRALQETLGRVFRESGASLVTARLTAGKKDEGAKASVRTLHVDVVEGP